MAGVRQVTDPPRRATARRPAPLLREAIGRVLREARTDRDERLVDVARQASISPQYLSEIERGAKDPSSEVLRSVSGALGLHPAEVVRRASSVMVGMPRRRVEIRSAAGRPTAPTQTDPARRSHLQVVAAEPLPAPAPQASVLQSPTLRPVLRLAA